MSLSRYKRIILHAGVHKTGTSFLQLAMQSNREVLERRSIHFPPYRSKIQHGGNHSLPFKMAEPGSDIVARLERTLHLDSECDTLLISAEELSREAHALLALPQLVKTAPDARFHAVIYFRRPDELVESVYAEMVKTSLKGDISLASYQIDPRKTLAPFIGALGKENVTVRPYNSRMWPDGSLGRDFFAAIREPDLWDLMAKPQEANVSFTRPETFLLSLIASPVAKAEMRKIFAEQPWPEQDRHKFFRPPEDRRRFVLSHRHMYEEVAQQFGLGDATEFFGLAPRDEQDWQALQPNYRIAAEYLLRLSDALAQREAKKA